MTPLLPSFTPARFADVAQARDRVYCCDALALLRSLPDASVDMAFLDPPYNLGYKYDNYNDKQDPVTYLEWCYTWLDETRRVLRDTGSLFVLHIPETAIDIAAHLKKTMRFRHWIAWKAGSRSSNKALMPEHYALLWFTKTDIFTANEIRRKHQRCRHCGEMLADYGGKKHLIHSYGPVVSDIWTDIGRLKHSERGGHPCALPRRLADRVLHLSTNEGDTVLDFFAGTGTLLDSARLHGRHYVGCDTSQFYVDIVRERLTKPFDVRLPMFEVPA